MGGRAAGVSRRRGGAAGKAVGLRVPGPEHRPPAGAPGGGAGRRLPGLTARHWHAWPGATAGHASVVRAVRT